MFAPGDVRRPVGEDHRNELKWRGRVLGVGAGQTFGFAAIPEALGRLTGLGPKEAGVWLLQLGWGRPTGLSQLAWPRTHSIV